MTNYSYLTNTTDRLQWWIDTANDHPDIYPDIIEDIQCALRDLQILSSELALTRTELARLRKAVNDAIDHSQDIYPATPLSPAYGGAHQVPSEVADDIADIYRETLDQEGWRHTEVTIVSTFEGTSVVRWRGKPPVGWDGETLP